MHVASNCGHSDRLFNHIQDNQTLAKSFFYGIDDKQLPKSNLNLASSPWEMSLL